jgi:hypothetical protein
MPEGGSVGNTSGAAGVARDGKDKGNRSNEGGLDVQSMVARRPNWEFWFENLRSLHRVIRRCSRLTVPAIDRRYFRLDFIEKPRRMMSGQAVSRPA